MGEEAWQGFAAYAGPLLMEMYSTLMWPSSFSPLQ